jgi:hypothetical protein
MQERRLGTWKVAQDAKGIDGLMEVPSGAIWVSLLLGASGVDRGAQHPWRTVTEATPSCYGWPVPIYGYLEESN